MYNIVVNMEKAMKEKNEFYNEQREKRKTSPPKPL